MTTASSGVAALAPHDAEAAGQRDVDEFRAAILGKLTYMVAKDPAHARDHDWLVATALAARDRVIDRWSETTRRTYRDGRKRVYYFSLEFLIGRMLFDALSNLGLATTARTALAELGVDFDRLRALEPTLHWGTGAWGASRHASWRAWPRSAFLRTATASVTTTASFARS